VSGGRSFVEWLVVTALCAGLAAAATTQGWLWRLDYAFYDAVMASRQASVDADVVIIAIDDRSLAEIGRWPWNRAVHALLLERLTHAGSRAVALDIILNEPEPDYPEGDAALARAIAANGRVVLPVTHASRGARSDGEALPTPVFTQAAAALGHIHIELDPDGIARSIYLWEGMHQPRHPQLSLALLALVQPETAAVWPAPAGPPAAGWRRADWMHIPFVGPPGSFRYLSYVDVLRGEVPDSLLRDKLVFIGASATGMGDIVPTPVSGHARPMPGVEVHATVLRALREGTSIGMLPGWQTGPLAALLVTGLMLVMLRSGPRFTLLVAFGLALAALAASALALRYGRVWLPPIGIVLGAMLAYPLWSWRRLEAAQHYLDAELTALDPEQDATENGTPARGPTTADRFAARIALVRNAARRQRDLQRSRDETMHFLSHDLRAPLASILTLTDMARDETPDPALPVRIGRYARKALDLADGLSQLGRAEAADPAHFIELPLDLLLQDAVDAVWPQAEAKHIRPRLDFALPEDHPCLVRGEGDLLLRALINLLTNAIKFSSEHGEVTVTLREETGGYAIDVRDDGPGIPEERQVLLFRRYSRLAQESGPRPDGVGLGLLMVRTVAERHGGSVKVASRVGEGSVFTLWLPGMTKDQPSPSHIA
jgi:CHASE2 domain-containing sensor protein